MLGDVALFSVLFQLELPAGFVSTGEVIGVAEDEAAADSDVVFSGIVPAVGVLGNSSFEGAAAAVSEGALSGLASVGMVIDVAGGGAGVDPDGVFSRVAPAGNGLVFCPIVAVGAAGSDETSLGLG